MKTMSKFFGLLILSVAMFSISANAATMVEDTNTMMGRYWLKKAVNPIQVDGKDLTTYVIHYDNFSKPVYVGILETKGCKSYIVRTEGFEVLYACRDGFFGINYVPKQLETICSDEAKSSINRTGYLRQRVISQKNYSEKQHLALIASYLPDVMM